MTPFDESASTNAWGRAGLWLCSLLVSVTLFSVFLSVFISSPGFFRVELVLIVLRVTATFAVPVWCLCLPFVIAVKNITGWRIWIVLAAGTLIGPVSFALLGLIALQRGDDPHRIWYGDPLLGVLGGVGAGMIFALIVGVLMTSFYVFALKAFSKPTKELR